MQQRGAAVIKARKLSSAMSAAKAICDHMRDIWFGTKGVSVDKEETAPRASGRSDKANVDWGEKIRTPGKIVVSASAERQLSLFKVPFPLK